MKKKLLIAFFITTIIFVLGLLLGLNYTAKSIKFFQEESYNQKLEFDDIQLQYRYLDLLQSEKKCDELIVAFQKNVDGLEETRKKIENLRRSISEEDYDLLMFDYRIRQIDYWLFSREMKKSCDTDYLTILYFFNGECGNDCREQALTLDSFKTHFGDKLLIFAIDGDYKNVDTINIIKKTFSINSYPTLIVEDKKYVGFSDNVKLLDIVCSLYDPVPEECNI